MAMPNKKRLFPKKEGDFLKSFMDKVRKKHPKVWFFKSHGEPMQTRGIPDILMCYYGLFIGIEFKIMRGGKIIPTPLQEYVQDLIIKACGISVVVWYDERNENVGIGTKRFEDIQEAIDCLLDALDYAKSIPVGTFYTSKLEDLQRLFEAQKGGVDGLGKPLGVLPETSVKPPQSVSGEAVGGEFKPNPTTP